MENLADWLPTWMARMMANVGRLTMLRSVLAVIPPRQLVVLGVSKKALKNVREDLTRFPLEGQEGGQWWALPHQLANGLSPAGTRKVGHPRSLEDVHLSLYHVKQRSPLVPHSVIN